VSDRAYFRRVVETRQSAMGNYAIGRTTGKPTVHFAYPGLDTQGTMCRIAMVGLDLAWLEKLAAEAELQEGAVLRVVDSEGTILVRWPDPERWRGKSIKNFPFAKRMGASGPALGIFPEYPFLSEECPLAPGDAILAFTDGVTEITASKGELFGESGCKKPSVGGWICQWKMRGFSATTTFEHDVCFVAVEEHWATEGIIY
jgi:Stage II sporulation protein E (SpoIIE)